MNGDVLRDDDLDDNDDNKFDLSSSNDFSAVEFRWLFAENTNGQRRARVQMVSKPISTSCNVSVSSRFDPPTSYLSLWP